MAVDALDYEIREAMTPDGGVALELVVEGSTVARATADATVLADLRSERGLDRPAIVAELRSSLVEVLKSQAQLVEIRDLKEERPLRFTARFTYRLKDQVTTGLVYYDVTASTAGPEEVPAVVRNRMRFEVHRLLTGEGTAARSLVDLHK